MNYDSFKHAFLSALRKTGLPVLNSPGEESLDPNSLDREYQVYVQPFGSGEVWPPFRVSASIWFRWDALLTARMATREEDVLIELHGRDGSKEAQTEQPCLRVDVELRAGLDWGKSLPMPSRDAWAKWTRETSFRLDSVERIVSEDVVRETSGNLPAVLAWQGDPEIRLRCDPAGELRLEEIRVAAFQMIDLPRQWDDPDREPDDDPDAQLADMFERVRAALHAWGEMADHLLPAGRE